MLVGEAGGRIGVLGKRLDTASTLAGMLVGVGIVSWSVLSGTSVLLGMNVGLVALALNLVITAAGSFTRSTTPARTLETV